MFVRLSNLACILTRSSVVGTSVRHRVLSGDMRVDDCTRQQEAALGTVPIGQSTANVKKVRNFTTTFLVTVGCWWLPLPTTLSTWPDYVVYGVRHCPDDLRGCTACVPSAPCYRRTEHSCGLPSGVECHRPRIPGGLRMRRDAALPGRWPQ